MGRGVLSAEMTEKDSRVWTRRCLLGFSVRLASETEAEAYHRTFPVLKLKPKTKTKKTDISVRFVAVFDFRLKGAQPECLQPNIIWVESQNHNTCIFFFPTSKSVLTLQRNPIREIELQ